MTFLYLCGFWLLGQVFWGCCFYGCTVKCLHNFSAFVLLVPVQLLILNRTAASEIHWRDGSRQCACLPLAPSWTGSNTAQEACLVRLYASLPYSFHMPTMPAAAHKLL